MINFRFEGRRFDRGRCLVPAWWFYEYRGAKAMKEKWKFTKNGDEWFCFAGLWRPASEVGPEAFTLLTSEPGPDVAPIHNRQMIVLDRKDWAAWLDSTKPERELLRALREGSLQAERVR